MKLGAVVSAVNLNPQYTQFVPQFVRAWTTLFPSIQTVVLLIANEIPEELQPYKKYIQLVPVDSSISTVFASQCIRLLWPRFLDTSDAVLISDIDMIPLQRDYYVNAIKDISDDTFVVYRHGLPEELYMCYVAGTPVTWRGLFGEESHADILARWYSEVDLSDIEHDECLRGCKSWNKDQIELTKAFNAWKGLKHVYNDRDLEFRRLCRSFLERKPGTLERNLIENRHLLEFNIKSGLFADYHMISNESHADFNEFVLSCLDGLMDRSAYFPETTYTSYLPLLFQAMVVHPGPVIECGMGYGSTELLHSTGRTVISYETNEEWLNRFSVPNKYLIPRDEWVSTLSMHKSAGPIIFIDQAPGESRDPCLAELATDFDGIIVAHDTEPAADHGYKMRQHFHKFRYVVEVKTDGAWATAMSNRVNLHEWIGLSFGKYTISPFAPSLPTQVVSPPIQWKPVSVRNDGPKLFSFLYRKQ